MKTNFNFKASLAADEDDVDGHDALESERSGERPRPAGPPRAVLVGNPNVGKSVLFGKLTGAYVTVSNYPGTTVEVSRGRVVLAATAGAPEWEVVDTPGTNNLLPVSDDEAVTRAILVRERHDALVQVGDAKALSRVLLLTLQLAETGLPFVLALNMMDELRARGLALDVARLSELLGVPVFATAALRGEGVDAVRAEIVRATTTRHHERPLLPLPIAPKYADDVESALTELEALVRDDGRYVVAPRALAALLLGGDRFLVEEIEPAIAARAHELAEALRVAHGMPVFALLNRTRLQVAQRMVREVQRRASALEGLVAPVTVGRSVAFGAALGAGTAFVLDGALAAVAASSGGDPLSDYGAIPIVARLFSRDVARGWHPSALAFGAVVAVVAAVAARRATRVRVVSWKAFFAGALGYMAFAIASITEQLARKSTGAMPLVVGCGVGLVALAVVASLGERRDVAAIRALGRLTMRPIAGLPFLFASLFLAYRVVGVFGAGTAVDFLENKLFGGVVAERSIESAGTSAPDDADDGAQRLRVTRLADGASEITIETKAGGAFARSAERITIEARASLQVVAEEPGRLVVRGDPAGHVAKAWSGHVNPAAYRLVDRIGVRWITAFVVGQYGLLTMGLTYAIAIVLPVVATFFFVFSILEDSGYLPRLAVMANRGMRAIGLNGKAVLPMILGLGCDTMATLTARVLESKKERVLTTLLLALAIPCSSQLTVVFAMMQTVSWKATAVWALVMVLTLLIVGWTAARVVPGDRSDFVLEVPPIRRPEIANLATKTLARIEWYLKEAVPLFLIGTVLLFALDAAHLLPYVHRAGEPIVYHALGFPRGSGVSDKVSEALLVGFLRRDFGAAGLLDLARHGQLSHTDVAVSMVVITLFIPCIANVFMIVKERGAKTALLMASFIFPFAIAAGALVRRLMG